MKVVGKDPEGNPIYAENDIYVNPQSYWQSFQDVSPEPFIIDASYIKFRELAFSFDFPRRWLRKTPIAGVSVDGFRPQPVHSLYEREEHRPRVVLL